MQQSQNEGYGPYQRSMQLLMKTVNREDSIEWTDGKLGKVEIFVRGMSRRWYKIRASQIEMHPVGKSPNPYLTRSWTIQVTAAAWRVDFDKNKKHVTSLCLNTNRKGASLPVGDSLAGLYLSLVNDKITAMQIPLLAQFIICPRQRLATIEIFQQEGIVTEEMLHQDEYLFDEEDWELDEEYQQHDVVVENGQQQLPTDFELLANLFASEPDNIMENIRELEDELIDEKRSNDFEKMIYDHERAADRVRGSR